jgi:hypothetical protein
VWSLDQQKVALFVAEQMLLGKPVWPRADFLSTWDARVPTGVGISLSLLPVGGQRSVMCVFVCVCVYVCVCSCVCVCVYDEYCVYEMSIVCVFFFFVCVHICFLCPCLSVFV